MNEGTYDLQLAGNKNCVPTIGSFRVHYLSINAHTRLRWHVHLQKLHLIFPTEAEETLVLDANVNLRIGSCNCQVRAAEIKRRLALTAKDAVL